MAKDFQYFFFVPRKYLYDLSGDVLMKLIHNNIFKLYHSHSFRPFFDKVTYFHFIFLLYLYDYIIIQLQWVLANIQFEEEITLLYTYNFDIFSIILYLGT